MTDPKLCELTLRQFLIASQGWSWGVWLAEMGVFGAGLFAWKRWRARKIAESVPPPPRWPSSATPGPPCLESFHGEPCSFNEGHPGPHGAYIVWPTTEPPTVELPG